MWTEGPQGHWDAGGSWTEGRGHRVERLGLKRASILSSAGYVPGQTSNEALSISTSVPDVHQVTSDVSHQPPCSSTAIAQSTIFPKVGHKCSMLDQQTLISCHFLMFNFWLSQ